MSGCTADILVLSVLLAAAVAGLLWLAGKYDKKAEECKLLSQALEEARRDWRRTADRLEVLLRERSSPSTP
jgi:hypothetical protein